MTDSPRLSDGTLVEKTLLGDSRSFEELVLRHEQAVKAATLRITRNPYSAEDAAQDAFVTAWLKLSSLREPEKFRPWVVKIARNRARTLLLRYEDALPSLSPDLTEVREQGGDEDPALSAVLKAETEAELHASVDALSASLRETVCLHYFQGLSVKEIAEKLGVPAGTVRWRLTEGRRQLRKGFGIVEKTYHENEPLVSRVRRQVEELKLWRLKNDKTGFAREYREVLNDLEHLEDSQEKQSLLAEVWLRGAWWLPGAPNDALRSKIKAAALAGHNDDVLSTVVYEESQKLRGEERIRFLREEQIPQYENAGFPQTLGALWFSLGVDLAQAGRPEEADAAFEKVLRIQKPSDYLYAAALAARVVEGKMAAAQTKDPERAYLCARGEVLRQIDGRWYSWLRNGYGRGGYGTAGTEAAILYYASLCDGLVFDPAMNPGETVSSADGEVILSCRKAEESIVTPAGIYEDCLIFGLRGEGKRQIEAETVLAPGVGIVRQVNRESQTEFLLTSAIIQGGEGYFPLHPGNRWEYHAESLRPGTRCRDEQYLEVIELLENQAVLSRGCFCVMDYDLRYWRGNILAARRGYYDQLKGRLTDVEPYFRAAEQLAETPREKVHTRVAHEVMRRIFATAPETNPDYTEYGRWNFFGVIPLERRDGQALVATHEDIFLTSSFEWKQWGGGWDMYAVGCNFLYEMMENAGGCLWNDAWVPGYAAELKKMDPETGTPTESALTVGEEETVHSPAGDFERCRHITAEVKCTFGYFSGHLEFWYAPGVGPVKFLRTVTEDGEAKDAVWLLTEYRGRGAGYFPVEDGLFRRYEAQGLGRGYHGSVEYTFVADSDGASIYKNALGTQDRAEYERMQAEKS